LDGLNKCFAKQLYEHVTSDILIRVLTCDQP